MLGASADSVLVTDGASPLLLRRPLEGRVNPYQPILLGLEQDGRPLFAADLDDPEAASHVAETGIGKLVSLREAGTLLPQSEGGLAAYLVALLNWHRRHRFCSACGSKTRVAEAGLARRCPDCKASHFPRTDPVVIMVVDDGRRQHPARPPDRLARGPLLDPRRLRLRRRVPGGGGDPGGARGVPGSSRTHRATSPRSRGRSRPR